MENVRIASTPLAGLRPVGQGTTRDFDRLVSGLSQLSPERGELFQFFAEPVASRDRNSIDWYGPGGKIYTRLSVLAEDQRDEVLARVDEIMGLLQRESERLDTSGDPQGELIAAALCLPAPREDYIFVGRDIARPDSWHPVLVGWAHVNDAPARTGALPKVMVREVVRPSVPPAAARVAAPAILASAPAMVATVPVRRGWWWLLWILLTLLLLIVAWMLLRACGMGLPGYGLFHDIGTAFCPGAALAATSVEAEDARRLGDLARQLELELVRKQIVCAMDAGRSGAGPSPSGQSPSGQPASGATSPDGDKGGGRGGSSPDIDKRLQDAKAQTGEFQVSLAWDGNADLDLHVVCPGGEEISYSQRGGCGGRLDLDMNGTDRKSTTPVENASWPEGQAPKGRYRIAVKLYDRKDDTRPSIPFQVRIKDGANVKVVPGSVQEERKLVDVTEFER